MTGTPVTAAAGLRIFIAFAAEIKSLRNCSDRPTPASPGIHDFGHPASIIVAINAHVAAAGTRTVARNVSPGRGAVDDLIEHRRRCGRSEEVGGVRYDPPTVARAELGELWKFRGSSGGHWPPAVGALSFMSDALTS